MSTWNKGNSSVCLCETIFTIVCVDWKVICSEISVQIHVEIEFYQFCIFDIMGLEAWNVNQSFMKTTGNFNNGIRWDDGTMWANLFK